VIRAGGTLVTIDGPTEARPSGGLTIDFVVVPDRAQLSELVQQVRRLALLRLSKENGFSRSGSSVSSRAHPVEEQGAFIGA